MDRLIYKADKPQHQFHYNYINCFHLYHLQGTHSLQLVPQVYDSKDFEDEEEDPGDYSLGTFEYKMNSKSHETKLQELIKKDSLAHRSPVTGNTFKAIIALLVLQMRVTPVTLMTATDTKYHRMRQLGMSNEPLALQPCPAIILAIVNTPLHCQTLKMRQLVDDLVRSACIFISLTPTGAVRKEGLPTQARSQTEALDKALVCTERKRVEILF